VGQDERDKALRAARALEKKGEPDEAADQYVRAGAHAEAVRVLTAARKYVQAAQVLIAAHGIQTTGVARLDAEGKRQALTAAILLGRGGETRRAVDLFVALGEKERAAELLRRSGDAAGAERLEVATGPTPLPRSPAASAATAEAARKLEAEGRDDSALQIYLSLGQHEDAARVSQHMRRYEQAAQLYLKASKPYEAAQCSLAAGRLEQACDALAKASREDPRYRVTCRKMVAAAAAAKALSYSLEHFLGPFVSSEPKDAAEAEAFYTLAGLYAEKGLVDNAAEVYRRLLLFDARFRDASARLKKLTAAGALLSEAIAREDLAATQTPGPPLPGEVTERTTPDQAKATPAPATARADAFVEGALIADRYKLVSRIGKGGMAAVFRALDLELSIEVALKVYFPAKGGDDADLLARFRRELRFARSVIHPNVVRVFDIGVHEGQRYITMELLKGTELRGLFKGPLPIPQALGYLIQACAGLQAAHDQGLVHRDVKPANLFVTAEGVVKLMDFGIARVEGAARELTRAGAVAGTPGYMAPEQIRDSSLVTPSADIYSLGVVAYRALTGVMPFIHPDTIPLLMMHLERPPPPLREHNPFIPAALEQVVLRCLAKDPQDRWPSCTALAAELERLRG
jgi:eukaryotic-like serine/threonine-protein kinase